MSKPELTPSAWFAQRVRAALAEVPRGSVSALAEATGISRYTLKRMVDGEDVRLWISQISSLDRYLVEQHQIHLLRKDSLVKGLADQAETVFVLPGYSSPEQRATSATWDVLAMAAARTEIERAGDGSHTFSFRSLDRLQASLADVDNLAEGANVICVGSPRAFPTLGNQLLERMFFSTDETRGLDPPFRFFWADGGTGRFSLAPGDVEHAGLKQEIAERGSDAAWAVEAGGRFFISPRNVTHGVATSETYGVVAACWNRNGALVTLNGLSGPGTESLGRCLGQLHAFLPRPTAGVGSNDVVWYLVGATIEGPASPPERGDQRRIVERSVKVVSGPHYWPPRARERSAPGPSTEG